MTVLRPARLGEAGALTELALRSKAMWGYDADFMRACLPALTVSEQQIAAGGVSVAECDGRLAGFVAISREGPDAEVDMLFVDPEAVQAGIGKALMEWAEAIARTDRIERLHVLSDPHAAGFYEACGFVRVGDAPSDAISGRRLPALEKRLDGAVSP